MSKNKTKAKVIKKKKKFNWTPIVTFLRTLYNNEAVVNISLNTKWYWSIIFFVVSTLISIIPVTVQTSQTQGSSYISGGTSDAFLYGLNDYVNNATEDQQIIFTKDGLIDTSTKQSTRYDGYYIQGDASKNVYKPIFSYEREGNNELDIYVVTDNVEALSDIANNITNSNTNYGDALVDGDDEKKDLLKENIYTRSTSFILFTKNAVYSKTYKGTTASTALNGNFNHLLEAFKDLSKKETYTLKDMLTYNTSDKVGVVEKQSAYLENYRTFSDFAYIDQRTSQTWVSFGIYCGINGGLILIMGLVTFLMTRGKNNPNRTIKFYECFSMAFWSSFSPAVLSLILGFLMPSFGMMSFLMFYSFRIMFLSMKHLRPAY